MGCHFLLQGIFPTQGLNPGLLHCRQTLYCLSHQGSPELLYDPVFHCWILKGNEIYIWKEIYSQRFVAALVTIAKIWKQVSVHWMNDKETVFFRYPEFLESFVVNNLKKEKRKTRERIFAFTKRGENENSVHHLFRIYTTEHYSAIRKKGILTFVTA